MCNTSHNFFLCSGPFSAASLDAELSPSLFLPWREPGHARCLFAAGDGSLVGGRAATARLNPSRRCLAMSPSAPGSVHVVSAIVRVSCSLGFDTLELTAHHPSPIPSSPPPGRGPLSVPCVASGTGRCSLRRHPRSHIHHGSGIAPLQWFLPSLVALHQAPCSPFIAATGFITHFIR